VFAMEELEANARLALLFRGLPATALNQGQIARLVERFNVDWT